jgi:hypothetical protein
VFARTIVFVTAVLLGSGCSTASPRLDLRARATPVPEARLAPEGPRPLKGTFWDGSIHGDVSQLGGGVVACLLMAPVFATTVASDVVILPLTIPIGQPFCITQWVFFTSHTKQEPEPPKKDIYDD